MKRRIYLSEDDGAAALVAAYGENHRWQIDWVSADVVTWGRKTGMDWAQVGRLWPGGSSEDGHSLFFGGVRKNGKIVEMAIHHFLPLVGASPLDWEMILLTSRSPKVQSWDELEKQLPRLFPQVAKELKR
ncbi:hypothetical protein [Polycladomyces subterraneus]|jgi:hypothetical protein|uniref:VapC45 PIN like domain-containing protein n=1 Tax=Polycladomyces subterraneus TaxID=1016997 RepID=A0ABT8IN96_9BACL|nr:hypothetical protein [Polycladomyces subterraneus]MDN4594205.1 hypothetical protein [Polycladomyces subterraneus]